MIFKATYRVKGSQKIQVLTMSACDYSQARMYLKLTKRTPIVSLSTVTWELPEHITFPEVSTTCHVNSMVKARRRRGAPVIETMDV